MRELAKRATGRTLYILDEPTTGLHFEDVRRLVEVLNQLVEAGNSVLVIEHNLDVIKTADWIIDLGPDGGPGGGEVIAVGTPEDVARERDSETGRYLAQLLKRPKKRAGSKGSGAKTPKARTQPKAKKARPAKPKTPKSRARKVAR